MTNRLRPTVVALLAATLSPALFAQTFAGYDDFSGNGAKWDYFFRAPALTTGTNGTLSFTGSVLEFTKAANSGSYLLGWDGDGIPKNSTARLPASYTTSWVAELSATNRFASEAGRFSSVGFEVAVAPNAYTEITLENYGGVMSVRTETNSATAGVAAVAAPVNTDVRLRIAWNASERTLAVSYSFDNGASYSTLRTVPITEWGAAPTGGFYFELMGYSTSAAAVPSGQMYMDNFSITTVPADYARLANLSVRNVTAEGDRTLIVGFNVTGEGTRPLVVRAVSDTLSRVFNVPNTLSDVDVSLYSGTTLAGSATTVTAGMTSAFDRVGAFRLDATSTDAATVRAVTAGSYTVHAIPAPTAARREGVTLVEIYEDGRYGTRLTNLSARTELGNEPLIVGFAVAGPQAARVLVRAVGPGLAAFGLTNFVADPRISIVRMSNGQTIAQNNDWGTAAGVSAASTATAAFALPAGSKDAALVVDLEPGAYTVLLEKSDTTTGVVLAEVYQVPQ